MGDILRVLIEILGVFAARDAEVAEFLHGLWVGAPGPRERIGAILPERGASHAAVETIRSAVTEPPSAPISAAVDAAENAS